MRRLAHLSDLHLPARDAHQAEALLAALEALRPDVIVITGDLTRGGARREFRAAADFVARLRAPALIVPGNHDVPVRNVAARVLRPFDRFTRFVPAGVAPVFADGAVAIAGLNTARAVSLSSWDWSLGRVSRMSLLALEAAFSQAPQSALRIVACHHPLSADGADPRRSRTQGGALALETLARLDVKLVLHGHLHRAHARITPHARGALVQAGAATALCDRERGHGSGFNLFRIDAQRIDLSPWRWSGADYAPFADGHGPHRQCWNLASGTAFPMQCEDM